MMANVVQEAIQVLANEAQASGATSGDGAGIVRAVVAAHGLSFNAWFCVCCELADREARAAGYDGSVDRAYKLALAARKVTTVDHVNTLEDYLGDIDASEAVDLDVVNAILRGDISLAVKPEVARG